MLVELEARNFRNIEAFRWQLEGGAHLLLGDNGAGKTSLLEAAYLLATTRSFRTSQLADCLRHGAEDYHLAAEVDRDRRTRLEISYGADASHPAARRGISRRVNAQRTTLAEHLEVLPVICWTIEQAETLSGGPGHRRRFIDRGLLGIRPTALEIMSRYRQILAEKRRLLIEGGRGLEAWNQLQAQTAARWIGLRADYVAALSKVVDELLDDCDLGLPPLSLSYRCSPRSGRDGSEAIAAELAAVKERERSRRQALIGPHRDELEIRWADHAVRRTASAGEKKALGLVLLAAQGRILTSRGRRPLYLLDDVDTELDEGRLAKLWRLFRPISQVIATSNRPAVWEKIEVDRRWRCRDGKITPLRS